MAYRKTQLLTRNNHKTIKGEKMGYVTYILYMSPFTDNTKGINVCPFATEGCSKSCLFNSGMGGMYEQVRNGRKNKTEWFLENRKEFLMQLVSEINAAVKRHKDKAIVTVRLNGTSDISYEKFKIKDGKNIFELFPDIQFYDYTKNHKRFTNDLPKNYHLTFSRSEVNEKEAIKLLKNGNNVAVVFNKVLPEKYLGYKVVDGDDTDLRFLNDKGVIIGLKYKNVTGKNGGELNKFAKTSGFVVME